MRRLTKVLGTAVLLVSSAAGAQAAPQILGVVATAQPMKLHCSDGRCLVEVPTLCLQAQRQTPSGGVVYKPLEASVFSVLARNGAGKTVRVPMTGATFRVFRGYTASRVSIAASGLRARGLTPVALSVTRGTILIPAPVQGDPDPITPAEVARAKTALWPMARHLMKQRRQEVAAIGMVNRLVNETPLAGPMTAAARKTLWRDTFGTPAQAGGGGAAGRAAAELGICQDYVAKGLIFTLHGCLQTRADRLLTRLNIAYWHKAKHGGA